MMKQNSRFQKKTFLVLLILLLAAAGTWLAISLVKGKTGKTVTPVVEKSNDSGSKVAFGDWQAPPVSAIPAGEAGDQIRYGRALVAHTSVYLGPKGTVASISNGMNCQNCHNQAGTKSCGLNFSAVASTYPQFRNRSGKMVSIVERINSCFNRSLNGQSLDTAGKEMKAIVAYIKWLGQNVPEGVKPENAGVVKLTYLERAADPKKGGLVYATCQSCHGKEGRGYLNDAGTEYVFPPLWGPDSYNDGAGLYRLGTFAGFVKGNMPFGTTYKHPVLSDEEAWDVGAFVNSQQRPHKDESQDYLLTGEKPVDCPFGPYHDNFSEMQHKYGPFQPILLAKEKLSKEPGKKTSL
jgi:thiosulfate dehydrogenase